MAITFTSTDTTLTGIDFIKYLLDKPIITKGVNEPSVLDMTLAKWGSGFVLPRRGSYFTLGTTANPKFWTGFLTESPELEYLGKRSDDDQPQWSWKFKGTSDEYILNLAPIGIVPVYINQTQGAIIKDLANRIATGVFDVTNVQDGNLVPYFFLDPTRTFSEIVKSFAEESYYRFWANDYKLYFERQDVTPAKLVINGETNYTDRVRILSSTNTTPIVITTESAHGLSDGACVTIERHLVNANANGNWIIASAAGSTYSLVGSTGNGVGGNTGWAGRHNPHFTTDRLRIGPVNDPVIDDCIIIGDIEPQGFMNEYFVGDGFTGSFPLLSSIYGVDSALLLDEVFSGTTIDSNKWLEVDSINNVLTAANGYLQVQGNAADAYGVYLQSKSLLPLQGNLRLTHGEFDFTSGTNNNGVIASLWTSTPSGSLSGCVYGIRVTTSGGNVILNPIINGVVDSTQTYTAATNASNKRYIIRTLLAFENINRFTRAYLYRQITGTLGSYGGSGVPDRPVYKTIITEIDATNGNITTNQVIWVNADSNTGLANTQFYAAYVPALSNRLNFTLSNITLSVPMQVSLETIDKSVWYPQFYNYSIITGELSEADLTSIRWAPRIIGPNEIQSYDGMEPVATIVTTRAGRIDSGNILGHSLYNPGDATLVFFKDSIKQTTNTPIPGQLIHLKYRRAGIALGRAQNTALIASEAALWGDNGLRTLTRKDLSPLPKTSLEAEAAAAAIIEENSYQHYTGTYTQYSNYEFTGVPEPGTVLYFKNLPTATSSQFPNIQAELITRVVSTLESKSKEMFIHEVTFGKADKLKKYLSGLKTPVQSFAPQDTAEVPTASDLQSVIQSTTALSIIFNPITLTLTYGGTSSILPDTALDTNISLKLRTWTSSPFTGDINTLTIDIGQAPPPGGGFEIRYTDQGWGDVNNKNFLVYGSITDGKTTAQTFKILRNRNNVVFVRAYDSTGKYSRFSAGIRVVFPGIPSRIQGFKSAGGTLTHPRYKAILPTVDNTEDGVPILTSDIFGMEDYFTHLQSVSGWFLRNGSTLGTPYSAGTGDNPGQWAISATNPTGLTYQVNTITLPVTGTDLATQHGYINLIAVDAILGGYLLFAKNQEVVFFIWAKSDTNNTQIRLNIKDDLAVSPFPYGFYSRHDYTLASNATWYPIFTRVKLPNTVSGTEHFNLVIHNIGASTVNLKFALPLLGIGISSNQDVALGLSPDNPYLEFEYNNEGT